MRKSLALIAVALAAIVLIASKASAMPITKAGANELCQGHHMLGGLEANSKYFGCSWCYKTASGQTQCQYVGCDEDSCDWIVFREKTRTRFGILTPPSGYLRAERRSDRELACQYCYASCGRMNYICRQHCQTRAGCPAPADLTTR
jgi:hypothetical protein